MTKTQLRKAIKEADFDPTDMLWKAILENDNPAYYEGKIRESLALASLDPDGYLNHLNDIIRFAAITKVAHCGGLRKKKRPSRG
jgi:hypothetical protein